VSPTARSLTWLRERGYICDIVERWIAQAGIRRDLFHCIDVLAVKPGEIAGVQVSTSSNLAARLKKAQALPELRASLAAGGKFHLHGWKRVGQRWAVRVLEVLAVDLPPAEIVRPSRRRGGRGHQQRMLFDVEP